MKRGKGYHLIFNFEQKGLKPVTLKKIGPGQSLLEIALGNGIKLQHQCGGVCACSTCHLYVERGNELMERISRREDDFIGKATDPRPGSRLACQCILIEIGGDITVTLPDQTKYF